MKDSIIKLSKKLIIFVLWLFIWELCSLFVNQELFLPSPLNVFIKLMQLLKEPIFWKSVFFTMLRVIISLLLSIALGIFMGILSGFFKIFREFLSPFITAMKSTPVISIIIIALIWFKSSNVAIFTSILICFPIIYTNVLSGISSLDKKYIDLMNLYNVKWIYRIKNVYIPFIKTYIYSSILMCIGIGWKVVVASEVLSTPIYSIGTNLLNCKNMLETEELFAWTIVIVIFSLIFEKIFIIYIKDKKIHNLKR